MTKSHLRNLIFIFCAMFCACKTQLSSDLGKKAYDWTAEIVAFGPRTSGSPEIQKVRDWLEKKVNGLGLGLQKRPFVSRTPKGLVNMVNLSYVIPGTKHDERFVLLAHYDSKIFSDRRFVGANDAASSVALLLAISQPIQKMELPFDVEVVFVDGEEAFVEWNFNDSLYGSRQMAQDIHGMKIKGLIVVDMIGDKDLALIKSRGSDSKLFSYLEESLKEMNQSSKLEGNWSYVMDDHTPFVEMGIPTLHLMDFTFGGTSQPGRFWHTEQDNMENISADSLSIVGEAILRILKKIR